MSTNRVVIVGRLVKDPDVKELSNTTVANMYVAVDRIFRREEQEADFFAVTAFGKTAEFVSKYLGKGRLIAVDGRLQQRKYTTQDGQERNVVEIVADNVQGLDRPKDSPSDSAGPQRSTEGQAGASEEGDYDPFAPE